MALAGQWLCDQYYSYGFIIRLLLLALKITYVQYNSNQYTIITCNKNDIRMYVSIYVCTYAKSIGTTVLCAQLHMHMSLWYVRACVCVSVCLCDAISVMR